MPSKAEVGPQDAPASGGVGGGLDGGEELEPREAINALDGTHTVSPIGR
jgi:hypothetical protein